MFRFIYRRFIFLMIVTITVIALVCTFLYLEMHRDVVNLRKQENKKHARLFEVVFTDVGSTFKRWAYDNTYWDEMCTFVKTKDLNWAKFNIEEPLPLYKIDFVWVFNKDYDQIFSINIWKNAEYSALPFTKSELRKILDNKKLLNKEYPHFYKNMSGSIIEITALPIQPSNDVDRKTTPQGYFFAAKLMDKRSFQDITGITFSNINLYYPQQLESFENTVRESNVLVGSKIELKDYYGNTIAYLGSIYNSNPLEKLISSSRKNLFIISVCILFFAGAIIIAIFYWVVSPLNIISRSLITEDDSFLESLRKNSTEFGLVADLIHQFFEQRTSLQNEITLRSKSEKELLEIKSHLEELIDERTAELVASKEKAEAANKLKDAFIANISHEIRTPLNGVLGMAAIIRDTFRKHITPNEEKYFEAINSSSKRIIRTIDLILNFSRTHVGEFIIKPQRINLQDLLIQLNSEFILAASQKGLNLSFENNIGEVFLFSDNYCLTHIFSNIIDNAIKYTNSGSIKIIAYKNKDDKISVDITDTGIGISESYLEKLFEPYTQEEMGYSRAYEGIGLGLSLVKQFLSLIEAESIVKSQKGIGTTFTIILKDLPITAEAYFDQKIEIEHNQLESVEKSNLHETASVLVVEDEAINQLFLTEMLKDQYKVIVAANAEHALEEIEKKKFNIILMDISLKGGMNGIELTKELKKSSRYKSIPIIAITGHAFYQDKERCIEAGCSGYITKPFDIDELKNMITKYV